MSNRTKKGAAAPRTIAAAPAAHHGPAYNRGQQLARQFASESGWDELAEAIIGFKDGIRAEIEERNRKVEEQSILLSNASKALEA
jgi:hypothetical protein